MDWRARLQLGRILLMLQRGERTIDQALESVEEWLERGWERQTGTPPDQSP